MSYNSQVINFYKAKFIPFSNQAEIIAYRLISCLDACQLKSQGQQPDLKALKHTLNFDKAYQVNSNNLCCTMLAKICLCQLCHSNDDPLAKLLNEYLSLIIEPALERYKQQQLIAPIDSQPQLKASLKATLEAFNSLTAAPIKHFHQQQIDHKLQQKQQQYELESLLSQSFLNKAKRVISDKLATYASDPRFSFLTKLETVINKPQIGYDDIAKLKNDLLIFRQITLQLPEIKAIQEYHWLVNWLCDFLNHFGNFFESQASRDIKTLSDNSMRLIQAASQKVEQVESDMRAAISQPTP